MGTLLVVFYTKYIKITDLEKITIANHKQHIMNNATIYS